MPSAPHNRLAMERSRIASPSWCGCVCPTWAWTYGVTRIC